MQSRNIDTKLRGIRSSRQRPFSWAERMCIISALFPWETYYFSALSPKNKAPRWGALFFGVNSGTRNEFQRRRAEATAALGTTCWWHVAFARGESCTAYLRVSLCGWHNADTGSSSTVLRHKERPVPRKPRSSTEIRAVSACAFHHGQIRWWRSSVRFVFVRAAQKKVS